VFPTVRFLIWSAQHIQLRLHSVWSSPYQSCLQQLRSADFCNGSQMICKCKGWMELATSKPLFRLAPPWQGAPQKLSEGFTWLHIEE
jgi:hypothetical protein